MVAIAYVLRTATAGLRPEFEHERTRDRAAFQTDIEAPTQRSRNVNERPIRRFKLSWKRGSDGQRLLLTSAWKAARGSALAMAYVPLRESTSMVVRFVRGTLVMRRTSPRGTRGQHEMSVEIEEWR